MRLSLNPVIISIISLEVLVAGARIERSLEIMIRKEHPPAQPRSSAEPTHNLDILQEGFI